MNLQALRQMQTELSGKAALVAVSKMKPVEDILEAYEAGQRDFGENYVQELSTKQGLLPHDIRWHLIGRLQRNKVRQIANFVHLIHSVDRLELLEEINKQGNNIGRTLDVLLQIRIAAEETKEGLEPEALQDVLNAYSKQPERWTGVRICGLMGMASFTEDKDRVQAEFCGLRQLFHQLREEYFAAAPHFELLSMGMSGDYQLALECGSNMVRVGSLIFGNR